MANNELGERKVHRENCIFKMFLSIGVIENMGKIYSEGSLIPCPSNFAKNISHVAWNGLFRAFQKLPLSKICIDILEVFTAWCFEKLL